MNLTPDEALDVCGPDWSEMSDPERIAYGPKRKGKAGRADRVRLLIERLAAEWDGAVVWMRRAS